MKEYVLINLNNLGILNKKIIGKFFPDLKKIFFLKKQNYLC